MRTLAVPSLLEVITVVVILIPGFISLTLFRWLSKYERKISDNQLTLLSLSCSLVIYVIMGSITGIKNIDDYSIKIFEPDYLLLILSIGVLIGGIPGGIIGYVRRNVIIGECWEIAMRTASINGDWVIVYTNDNIEYLGSLHYSGMGNDPREISIRDPTMIVRNEKGEIENEFSVGKEIFFTATDIKRVAFYQEV